MPLPRRQGIFWLLTIPSDVFEPPGTLPAGVVWIRGQKEIGGSTGYPHWQVFVAFGTKQSLSGVLRTFPGCHAELSRSSAAISYVWKEETAVENTRFELGSRPINRTQKLDWESIWASAKLGDIMAIPASIRVQSYRTLRSIHADYAPTPGIIRTCYVFWGETGSGKSRTAWERAGMDAYCKDPRTKFWCGYGGEKSVVIDEFRGGIDVSHMLRWTDRYPVRVEVKGASAPLLAESLFITSNLHPRDWYPTLDYATYLALERRLIINEFKK